MPTPEAVPAPAQPPEKARRYPFLPDQPEIGWTPYVWLVYLAFPLVTLLLMPEPSGSTITLTLGSMAVFLPLYFWGFWLHGSKVLVPAALIFLLGAVVSPVNPGASCYFIYAAAYLGGVGRPGLAVRWLVALVTVLAALAWLIPLSPFAWIPGIVFSLIIGAVNIHQSEVDRGNRRLRLAREEVERLAKTAERERIARDLHDLLGHTLSVIALKAELAEKLTDRDPERAAREIREVHQVAREALGQVRRAVRGYREHGDPNPLAAELGNAHRAADAAGLELAVQGDPAALAEALGPARETVLALALREAVTNVVRHARASRCRLRFELAAPEGKAAPAAVLTVSDDGRGGLAPEGTGLAGMRERVEALGGRVLREGSDGTRLTVSLPVEARAVEATSRPGRLDSPDDRREREETS